MPRPRKGARLYLRKGRIDRRTGRPLPDVWCIVDGPREVSTGLPSDCLEQAESALAAYIAEKYAPEAAAVDAADLAASRGDPNQVLIAEVLALYAAERAPELATEAKTMKGFIKKLAAFWCEEGRKYVADVKRSTCKEYVTWRTAQDHGAYTVNPSGRKVSDQTARRELEVLSAAIGYWDEEHKLKVRPIVWLPEKAETNRDALTRSQAAALLWAAMGWQRQKDGSWKRLPKTTRTNRLHIRRFLLIGYYSGNRPGVTPKLLWEESATNAWADVEVGMIYRRGRQEKDHKTKRRPVVKLSDRLLAHMRRWREMDKALEKRRREEELKATGKTDFQLVSVVHFGGKPIKGRIRTAFEGCVADAGLAEEISPHWLRHTAATWLMEGGADLWEAASYLGMTTVTLEKHYGHHRPDFQSGARRAISGRR